MTIAKEEIFGPVLSVIRVETLDEAIGSSTIALRQHDNDLHRTAVRRASTLRVSKWEWWA